MAKSRQKGFTIIELIVVILLLGILTATALPRFIDVTDSAHDAVVDGVYGGLATGTALFRAQWVANGEPATAVTGFGDDTVFATTAGYPAGPTDATVGGDDCKDIFDLILQSGAPVVVDSGAITATGTIASGDVTDVSANADIVSVLDATANTCYYVYTGQFKTASSGSVPYITYNYNTGAVVLSATELTL